jgi:hypothetical protein
MFVGSVAARRGAPERASAKTIACCLACLLFAACGQKGALTLPKATPATGAASAPSR